MISREVTHRYVDPMDAIWIDCAKKIGFRIDRTDYAYASIDGNGTMLLARPASLDADDCLAQMIFHEFCHSLVEGAESFSKLDWGLDNESDKDIPKEHATLRVQAFLLDPYGLRKVLGPTTDFRSFYDSLPTDPLRAHDESVAMARKAILRSAKAPWAPHLREALQKTAQLADSMRGIEHTSDSLWSLLEPSRPQHVSGFFVHGDAELRCRDCAFWAEGRCSKTEMMVSPLELACERFEHSSLDCQECGACCSKGFDVLEMPLEDPFVKRHPQLVVLQIGRAELPRPGGDCPLLERSNGQVSCSDYAHRPKPCDEFEKGSNNCYFARTRVALSI